MAESKLKEVLHLDLDFADCSALAISKTGESQSLVLENRDIRAMVESLHRRAGRG
jgi:hypothetical protein